MNTLERSLIAKNGYETGWEVVEVNQESEMVLASARHSENIRITSEQGQGWIIELPTPLLQQELRRSLPDSFITEKHFRATDEESLAVLLRRASELAKSLPDQAAKTYLEQSKKALTETLPNEPKSSVW